MRIRSVLILLSFISAASMTACLPAGRLTVGAAATLLEAVAQSTNQQSDLKTVHEGTPAYLMLMDGMIETWPNNERLLLAAAQAYSSFSAAFVEDRDQEYARELTAKARRYALRSLELRGFTRPLQATYDNFKEGLEKLGLRDVPYLFWAAACWGSWIRLNLDSMEALSELPRVELMMKRVLDLDEGFYYGGPHLFMGIVHASRPKIAGGDLVKARNHFLRALELGRGNFLMASVYYAQYYARPANDRDLFVATLQKTLDTPADALPELTLLNTVARKRAADLLSRQDEYFE